jgi:hypothetical protein
VIYRPGHICDSEDRFEPCDLLPPTMGTGLFVPPHVEPVESLIADVDVSPGVELHALIDALTAA